MSSIDQRVVQMKFDNTQFEQGIKTTLGSLDSLNKGLKLEGATKGLTDVGSAAKGISLAHIADGVDSIAAKFNALSVIAITALSNITTKAIAAGTQLVKSLTIDPIKQGLSEYEDKLTSIQTILANTAKQGTTLKQVNEALNELNLYSDKTIYSFGEMTRSVKTFTTAGVDLKTSTASIKGLSNVAAVTGTNASDAARAMFQMSMALSSGSVRLQDWISLETAGGMGGKLFQDSLIETAKVHGVNVAKMIKDSGSFRLTLQEGWLTTKVLTETLSKFTGDLSDQQLKSMGYTATQIVEIQKLAKSALAAAQDVKTMTALFGTLKEAAGSGWASTWEIVFGNLQEATTLWTGVNNVIGGFINASSEARNKVLGDWKALGGRTAIIEAISNAFNALIAVLKPIKDAFFEIFPPITGKQLADLSVSIRNFTSHLKIGADTANNLKRTFAGVFSILGFGWDIIKAVATIIAHLFGVVSGGSGKVLELTARIGDWLVHMRKAVKDGTSVTKILEKIDKFLAPPIEKVKKLGEVMSTMFDGVDAKGGGEKFLTFLGKVWDVVEVVGKKLGAFFSGVGKLIASAFKGMSWSDILDTITNGVGIALAGGVGLLIKKIFDLIKGKGKGPSLFDTIKDSFNQLTDTLKSMQSTLRAATLIQLAVAIGILTIAVVALSKIDAEGLNRALTAMAVMFIQLGTALYVFEKHLDMKDIGKMYAIAGVMIVLGVAIDILVVAVKKLSELSWDQLAKGLTGLAVLLGIIVATVQLMPDDKKLFSTALAVAVLAGAIKLLVMSVTELSGLSWEEMAKGLVGVGTLLGALVLFTKFVKTDKAGLSSGLGILLLAVAIKILATAMTDIAKLSWEQVAKGIVGIASGLVLIIGSMKLLPPSSIFGGAGILIISLGLLSIATALEKLGKMGWMEIAKAVVALDFALVSIASALEVLPPSALWAAASILIVAISLTQIGEFLQKMSKMSWEEIGKSMLMLFGALTLIALGMAAMTEALPGAVALVVVAAALLIMAPILERFGNMSWDQIIKGLTMLAGIFLVLGVAGLVLAPVIPFILLLGVAVYLLGAGMLVAGVGVLAFGLGLAALGALGVDATKNIVNMVESLLGLIPKVMEQIGLGIIAFAEVIATGGPAIALAMTTVLLSLITAIDTVAPKIIETLFKLLLLFYETLVKYVPKLVDAGLKLLIGFLQGIANNIGGVITAATDVIVAFLNGIANNLSRIIQSGVNLLISFIEGVTKAVRENSERLGKAGGDLAVAIVEGMVKGLGSGSGKIADAAKSAAKAALDAALKFLGIKSPSKEFEKVGRYSDEGFALGLDKFSGLVGASAEGVGQEALSSIRKSISGLSDIVSGDMDMTPVITPVLDLTNVKKNAELIGSMLSTKPISVDATYSSAQAASSGYQSNKAVILNNEKATSQTGDLTFNQYNSSPKALSPAEIYRQTKNQLSVVGKGAPK